MTNKTELKEEELSKVTGGKGRTGSVYQTSSACGDFICTSCGGGLNSHTAKVHTGQMKYYIFKSPFGYWDYEWPGNSIDCNHCKYYDDKYHCCHAND